MPLAPYGHGIYCAKLGAIDTGHAAAGVEDPRHRTAHGVYYLGTKGHRKHQEGGHDLGKGAGGIPGHPECIRSEAAKVGTLGTGYKLREGEHCG